MNFIPIKHTDFVFAVISEEFGFLGSSIVLLLYLVLITEIFKVVKLCKYTAGKMIAGCIGIIIFFQILINVGMNIGIMPVTGITLPLLSYGGSSILVILTSLGIVHNIYKEYLKGEE